MVMAFNAIFNNIWAISWQSVILWRSVLLVEETGVSGQNHRPVASHWQTLSHSVLSSTPRHECGSNSQLKWWYQSRKIIGLLKVCFLLGFIGWNLYLVWSSVDCRHNVRHIRTIPFLLPPDWDGWPLNFTITHFLYKSTHVEFKTLSTVETLTPKHK